MACDLRWCIGPKARLDREVGLGLASGSPPSHGGFGRCRPPGAGNRRSSVYPGSSAICALRRAVSSRAFNWRIITSRFACSEAEAAAAWEIGRPNPESTIKPVRASRRVRAVERSVWITAGLKSFLLPSACRDLFMVAARKPYSGAQGFLQAIAGLAIALNSAFEEQQLDKALLMVRILEKSLNVWIGGWFFGLEHEELFGSDEVVQRSEFGMVFKCPVAHGDALGVWSRQIFENTRSCQ
ncbi:hypothetical protein L1887_48734 [Cichorium endivia]|nr:hypothetical protein L1887_48734 [Cichorium endivia]